MIPPPAGSAIFKSRNLFEKDVRAQAGGLNKYAFVRQLVGMFPPPPLQKRVIKINQSAFAALQALDALHREREVVG